MPTRVLYEVVVAAIEAAADAPEPDDAKARTRGRILRTATDLFTQFGYRRTSIDEVARRAGIAKGTVYVHFKSKAELLLQVLVEEKRRLIVRYRDVFRADITPDERLRRYIRVTLATLAESPLSMRLLSGDHEILLYLEELPADRRASLEGQGAEWLGALLAGVGQFDQLTADEQAERLHAFEGFHYSLGHLASVRARTGLSMERYTHQVAAILVAGLGAP
jgi:AcrR family transcriptional regulator